MIITCPSCKKKFEVNDSLIPKNGRLLNCGSCNETWFFNNDNTKNTELSEPQIHKKVKNKREIRKKIDNVDSFLNKVSTKSGSNKGSEIIKYEIKSSYTFTKFLSHILVLFISCIALIIVLDTFKSPLYGFFPNLEFILFNLYETLKDIKLFVKDLI